MCSDNIYLDPHYPNAKVWLLMCVNKDMKNVPGDEKG